TDEGIDDEWVSADRVGRILTQLRIPSRKVPGGRRRERVVDPATLAALVQAYGIPLDDGPDPPDPDLSDPPGKEAPAEKDARGAERSNSGRVHTPPKVSRAYQAPLVSQDRNGERPDDYAAMHPCPGCAKLIPPEWERCVTCEQAAGVPEGEP